jgi:hypothetical protein
MSRGNQAPMAKAVRPRSDKWTARRDREAAIKAKLELLGEAALDWWEHSNGNMVRYVATMAGLCAAAGDYAKAVKGPK